MENDLLGRVAVSKAGRDKGRSYVIVEVVDHEYVLVADGDLRKLSHPKRKKLKHLSIQKAAAELIKMKLSGNERVIDAELRKSLAELGYNIEANG